MIPSRRWRSFGRTSAFYGRNSGRSGQILSSKTIRSLLFITLAVAGGSLLLVFALVVLFSGRAIAPYLRNLAAQKQFITNASHELKTPLTAISTSADVLAMESGENEWVQNIQSQSGRLSRRISSLVTLCRLDEENPFPERTEFSLSDAVWEIAEPFSSLAAAKGKEYTQYIEDGITITGGRTAIGRLVSILLDNAIKYSADCGVIRLHVCRSGERAEIEVYFTLVLCSGTPFSSITVDKFQGINNILLFQLWYSHAAPPIFQVHLWLTVEAFGKCLLDDVVVFFREAVRNYQYHSTIDFSKRQESALCIRNTVAELS